MHSKLPFNFDPFLGNLGCSLCLMYIINILQKQRANTPETVSIMFVKTQLAFNYAGDLDEKKNHHRLAFYKSKREKQIY